MPTLSRSTRSVSKMGSRHIMCSADSLTGGLNTFTESALDAGPVHFTEFQTVGFMRSGKPENAAKRKPAFLLTSSKFGIDGSSPPVVSSWGYKPIRKKVSNCEDHCPERRSCSRNSLPEVHSPKWGFTSPAFHCKKTSLRTSQLTSQLQQRERSRSQNAVKSRAKVQNPDMTVHRANLFSRPHKEIPAAKRDGACKHVFASHSCPVPPVSHAAGCSLNKLAILDFKPSQELGARVGQRTSPQGWAIHGHLVSGRSCYPGQNAEKFESDPRDGQSKFCVRKIDIKLPCLPWN